MANACETCKGFLFRTVDFFRPPPRRPLTPPLKRKTQEEEFEFEEEIDEEDEDEIEEDEDLTQQDEDVPEQDVPEQAISKPSLPQPTQKKAAHHPKPKKPKPKKKKKTMPKAVKKIIYRKRKPDLEESAFPFDEFIQDELPLEDEGLLLEPSTQPSDTTRQPAGSDREPGDTSEQPSDKEKQSAGSDREPSDISGQPSDTGNEPKDETKQPSDITRQLSDIDTHKSPGDTHRSPGDIAKRQLSDIDSYKSPGDTHRSPGDITKYLDSEAKRLSRSSPDDKDRKLDAMDRPGDRDKPGYRDSEPGDEDRQIGERESRHKDIKPGDVKGKPDDITDEVDGIPVRGRERSIFRPEDLGGFKPDISKLPGDMDKLPGDMDKLPGDMDKRPGDMDKRPGDMDKGPGGMDKRPGENDKKPGGVSKDGLRDENVNKSGDIAKLLDDITNRPIDESGNKAKKTGLKTPTTGKEVVDKTGKHHKVSIDDQEPHKKHAKKGKKKRAEPKKKDFDDDSLMEAILQRGQRQAQDYHLRGRDKVGEKTDWMGMEYADGEGGANELSDEQRGKLDEASLRQLALDQAWYTVQNTRFLSPRHVARDAPPEVVLARLRKKAGIKLKNKKQPGAPYKEAHGPIVASFAWRGPEPAGWGCGCPGQPCVCFKHACDPPAPIPQGGRGEGSRRGTLWARLEARLLTEYRLHEKLRDLPMPSTELDELKRPLFCLGLDRCFVQREMRRKFIEAGEAAREAARKGKSKCDRRCRRDCTIDYSETIEALREQAAKEAAQQNLERQRDEKERAQQRAVRLHGKLVVSAPPPSPAKVCAERKSRIEAGVRPTPLPLRCYPAHTAPAHPQSRPQRSLRAFWCRVSSAAAWPRARPAPPHRPPRTTHTHPLDTYIYLEGSEDGAPAASSATPVPPAPAASPAAAAAAAAGGARGKGEAARAAGAAGPAVVSVYVALAPSRPTWAAPVRFQLNQPQDDSEPPPPAPPPTQVPYSRRAYWFFRGKRTAAAQTTAEQAGVGRSRYRRAGRVLYGPNVYLEPYERKSGPRTYLSTAAQPRHFLRRLIDTADCFLNECQRDFCPRELPQKEVSTFTQYDVKDIEVPIRQSFIVVDSQFTVLKMEKGQSLDRPAPTCECRPLPFGAGEMRGIDCTLSLRSTKAQAARKYGKRDQSTSFVSKSRVIQKEPTYNEKESILQKTVGVGKFLQKILTEDIEREDQHPACLWKSSDPAGFNCMACRLHAFKACECVVTSKGYIVGKSCTVSHNMDPMLDMLVKEEEGYRERLAAKEKRSESEDSKDDNLSSGTKTYFFSIKDVKEQQAYSQFFKEATIQTTLVDGAYSSIFPEPCAWESENATGICTSCGKNVSKFIEGGGDGFADLSSKNKGPPCTCRPVCNTKMSKKADDTGGEITKPPCAWKASNKDGAKICGPCTRPPCECRVLPGGAKIQCRNCEDKNREIEEQRLKEELKEADSETKLQTKRKKEAIIKAKKKKSLTYQAEHYILKRKKFYYHDFYLPLKRAFGEVRRSLQEDTPTHTHHPCAWLKGTRKGFRCWLCKTECTCTRTSDSLVKGESCADEMMDEEELEEEQELVVEDWPRFSRKICGWMPENLKLSKYESRKCAVCKKRLSDRIPCDCKGPIPIINKWIKGEICKTGVEVDVGKSVEVKRKEMAERNKKPRKRHYPPLLPEDPRKAHTPCGSKLKNKRWRTCKACALAPGESDSSAESENEEDLLAQDSKSEKHEDKPPCSWYSGDREKDKICKVCRPVTKEKETTGKDIPPCAWNELPPAGRRCGVCNQINDELVYPKIESRRSKTTIKQVATLNTQTSWPTRETTFHTQTSGQIVDHAVAQTIKLHDTVIDHDTQHDPTMGKTDKDTLYQLSKSLDDVQETQVVQNFINDKVKSVHKVDGNQLVNLEDMENMATNGSPINKPFLEIEQVTINQTVKEKPKVEDFTNNKKSDNINDKDTKSAENRDVVLKSNKILENQAKNIKTNLKNQLISESCCREETNPKENRYRHKNETDEPGACCWSGSSSPLECCRDNAVDNPPAAAAAAASRPCCAKISEKLSPHRSCCRSFNTIEYVSTKTGNLCLERPKKSQHGLKKNTTMRLEYKVKYKDRQNRRNSQNERNRMLNDNKNQCLANQLISNALQSISSNHKTKIVASAQEEEATETAAPGRGGATAAVGTALGRRRAGFRLHQPHSSSCK